MQEYVPMDNLHSYLIRKNLENLYISVAYKEVEKLQLVHARGSTRISLEYPKYTRKSSHFPLTISSL